MCRYDVFAVCGTRQHGVGSNVFWRHVRHGHLSRHSACHYCTDAEATALQKMSSPIPNTDMERVRCHPEQPDSHKQLVRIVEHQVISAGWPWSSISLATDRRDAGGRCYGHDWYWAVQAVESHHVGLNVSRRPREHSGFVYKESAWFAVTNENGVADTECCRPHHSLCLTDSWTLRHWLNSGLQAYSRHDWNVLQVYDF